MAKGSSKRINASNATILQRLKGLFLLVKLTLSSPYENISQLITFLVTVSLSCLFYWQIKSLAGGTSSTKSNSTATTSTAHVITEAGLDLDSPGLHQYLMDYIYVVAATHLLATLSRWGWYLLSVIPVYGLYKLLSYLACRSHPSKAIKPSTFSSTRKPFNGPKQ